MNEAIAIAAIDSITTGTLRAKQLSCLPLIVNSVISPVLREMLRCVLEMLAVGFIATENMTGLPLEIPPLIPPAEFFEVLPEVSIMGSLCSEPFISAAANPSPNSIPLIPGIENMSWEILDSRDSKNGSPIPAGTRLQVHFITPPIESPSAIIDSM